MIAVIDYGVGNLFSLESSLSLIGAKAVVTRDSDTLARADGIILPGVGAFEDAKTKLDASGMRDVLDREVKNGKPVLGICLGMQMLYEKSLEYGEHAGLGYVRGKVVPFQLPREMKIPHMGWNSLKIKKECPLLRYVEDGEYAYFVHSYYACTSEDTVASAEYGSEFTAVVQKGKVFGTQFHPEKSGETGLNILRAFCEIAET